MIGAVCLRRFAACVSGLAFAAGPRGRFMTGCLGVHFTVGLDLDVPRSKIACDVFEWLPMTIAVSSSWHECGTPPLVSIWSPRSTASVPVAHILPRGSELPSWGG
jgi:hypothetical protein